MAIPQRMYARALYDAAAEQHRVDRVRADFTAFANALAATPELQGYLENPQLEPGAKADLLLELTDGADELFRNTLRLLAEKGRAGEIEVVHDEFEAIADRAQGRISVELTTAHELSDTEAAEIVAAIERASGRTVEASRHVDPSLIGGMVLRIGSHRVDASVRGRLEGLRRELAAAR